MVDMKEQHGIVAFMASKETALELFDQWVQQEVHETQDKAIGHNTLVGSKELELSLIHI